MLIQFVRFLCCTSVVFSSLQASATKERGGGNVDVNGNLAEHSMSEESIALDPQELRVLLLPLITKIGGELPGLFEDLLFTDDSNTRWFLNSGFDARGCEFKSLAHVETRTVACQDYDSEGLTEIRILKDYWRTASDAQKSDLILHERIRSLLYKNGVNDCETCLFRAVLALKAPASATYATDVRDSLRLNKVGVYFLQIERIGIMNSVTALLENACRLSSEAEYRKLLTATSRTLLDPSIETKAIRYLIWLHSANRSATCSDIHAANENALNYYRGEQAPQ